MYFISFPGYFNSFPTIVIISQCILILSLSIFFLSQSTCLARGPSPGPSLLGRAQQIRVARVNVGRPKAWPWLGPGWSGGSVQGLRLGAGHFLGGAGPGLGLGLGVRASAGAENENKGHGVKTVSLETR